jgi:HPt (histidine-containing phosphotransfer) domain-containing protein
MDLFLRTLPVQLAALRDAIECGDANMLRRGAHKLRGSSGTIGAMRVSGLCARLENGGVADALPLLEELEDAAKKLTPA